MIVSENLIADLAIHFAILLIAGGYFRYICRMRTIAFVGITLMMAIIVTIMNNWLWPELRLSRVILIEAQQQEEEFHPYDCPYHCEPDRR